MGLGKRGNEVDQQPGESSLFSEIRNTGHVSNIRVKQIDKVIQYAWDNDEVVVNKIFSHCSKMEIIMYKKKEAYYVHVYIFRDKITKSIKIEPWRSLREERNVLGLKNSDIFQI